MTRFLFGDLLWKAIASKAKKAHRTKAAIAYASKEGPFSFKPDDVLIVDASDKAVAFGETSAAVLGKLLKRGVRLYSHTGLHAKVVIVDSVLFASSANLSESSISKLFEAGIETDNPNSVSGAVGMIERLTENSVQIDADFVARIRKIVVVKGGGAARSSVRTTPKGHREPVTWLMGVHDIEEPKHPDELKRIEAGTAKAETFFSNPKSSASWIRYRLKGSAAKVLQGDNLVIIRRSSAKTEPKRVFPHADVLWVQPEPNCIRIFYEDLPNAEKKSLSWARFKKLARLAGLKSNISKNSTRQLSDKISSNLKDEWEAVR